MPLNTWVLVLSFLFESRHFVAETIEISGWTLVFGKSNEILHIWCSFLPGILLLNSKYWVSRQHIRMHFISATYAEPMQIVSSQHWTVLNIWRNFSNRGETIFDEFPFASDVRNVSTVFIFHLESSVFRHLDWNYSQPTVSRSLISRASLHWAISSSPHNIRRRSSRAWHNSIKTFEVKSIFKRDVTTEELSCLKTSPPRLFLILISFPDSHDNKERKNSLSRFNEIFLPAFERSTESTFSTLNVFTVALRTRATQVRSHPSAGP